MTLQTVIDELTLYNNRVISDDELEAWVAENIVFKRYIPIAVKFAIIHNVAEKLPEAIQQNTENNNDIELLYMIAEIYAMYFVVLAYTDISIENAAMSAEYYDLIKQSIIYKNIRQYAGLDLDDFMRQFQMATGLYDFNIAQIISNAVNSTITTDDIASLQKAFGGLNTETIQLIKDVVSFNSPAMNNLNKQLQTAAMNNATQTMKKRGRKKKTPVQSESE